MQLITEKCNQLAENAINQANIAINWITAWIAGSINLVIIIL